MCWMQCFKSLTAQLINLQVGLIKKHQRLFKDGFHSLNGRLNESAMIGKLGW